MTLITLHPVQEMVYPPEKRILVSGNPRSGNVWIARLLAGVLKTRISPYKGKESLAWEADQHLGEYSIYQTHISPIYEGDYTEFFATDRLAFVPKWAGEKVVHIFRDPRDIAVSVLHYWKLRNVNQAIERMANNIGGILRWDRFVSAWLDCQEVPVVNISYEALLGNTRGELERLLKDLNIPSPGNIETEVERQSFVNTKKRIEAENSKPRAEHIRRGIMGEWREVFGKKDLILIQKEFGEVMGRLGYE